jgi:hypothetical protein
MGDIDAQHLAEQRRQALAIADAAVRIAAAAAIADADVQETIRPEVEVS